MPKKETAFVSAWIELVLFLWQYTVQVVMFWLIIVDKRMNSKNHTENLSEQNGHRIRWPRKRQWGSTTELQGTCLPVGSGSRDR